MLSDIQTVLDYLYPPEFNEDLTYSKRAFAMDQTQMGAPYLLVSFGYSIYRKKPLLCLC